MMSGINFGIVAVLSFPGFLLVEIDRPALRWGALEVGIEGMPPSVVTGRKSFSLLVLALQCRKVAGTRRDAGECSLGSSPLVHEAFAFVRGPVKIPNKRLVVAA